MEKSTNEMIDSIFEKIGDKVDRDKIAKAVTAFETAGRSATEYSRECLQKIDKIVNGNKHALMIAYSFIQSDSLIAQFKALDVALLFNFSDEMEKDDKEHHVNAVKHIAEALDTEQAAILVGALDAIVGEEVGKQVYAIVRDAISHARDALSNTMMGTIGLAGGK